MEALTRKWLTVLLACLPLVAIAEMPKGTETQYLQELAFNPKDSARALGGLRSARGLKAIVEAGAPTLLGDYERGLLDRGFTQFPEQRSPMPPEMESILLQRFDDPVWGKKLLRLVYWEKYQTRELFDRLYAHITDTQKFDDNNYWYRLIINTDQTGVEQSLLAAVPKLSADGQRVILSVLAQRKYAPALPEMATYMREHQTDPAWQTKEINDDLATMGSSESIEQLMLELGRFRKPLAGDDGTRLLNVIGALNALPKGAPLNVTRAWSAIPHKEDPAVAAACVAFAVAHPHPDESPLLVARLGDMKTWQGAFQALMGIDSPEVWQDTRAKIEALHQAGTLPEGNYLFAKQELSQRLDRPSEYRAKRDMAALNAALEAEATPIQRKYGDRSVLAQRDPAAYVPYATKYVGELQTVADKYSKANFAVGLRGEIHNERMLIARTQRFSLHQPREALATDQALLEMPDQNGSNVLSAIQAAEISRYELHDKAGAIRYYEKALELSDNVERGGATADRANPFRTWIGHEIDFLKTGQPFTGRITRDDLGLVGLLWMMGAGGGLKFGDPYSGRPPTAQEIGAALDLAKQQPPSYEQLGAAAMQFGRFPNAAVLLEFFERNDPARYLSGCLLAMYEYAKAQPGGVPSGMPESSPVLQQAVVQFKQRTGTTFSVTADARFATPEKTWEAFRTALRNGDRAAAVSCYTGQMKQTLAQLFAQMSDADLAKMAAGFSGLQASTPNMGEEIREYAIVRHGTPNNQAGFVEFVNHGGEWLIESM